MDKSKDLIVAGATSKIGIFLCKFPFVSMLILTFCMEAFAIIRGENTNFVIRALWIQLGIYGFLSLIIHLTSGKWCYKIVLDQTKNTITFYRLCNKPIHTYKINNIKIIITSYCHILIQDSDYILHADYIHDLVSFLPKDTVVEYKGRIGKYKEQNWEKGPLVPGARL